MSAFTLELLDGSTARRIDGVTSLVAEDASGQFGIQPRHEPMVTALAPGLVRYRCDATTWQYLASAGGVLVCRGDAVQIVSACFVLAPRDELLASRLALARASEHATRVVDREARARLERSFLRRLRELSSGGQS